MSGKNCEKNNQRAEFFKFSLNNFILTYKQKWSKDVTLKPALSAQQE